MNGTCGQLQGLPQFSPQVYSESLVVYSVGLGRRTCDELVADSIIGRALPG